MADTKMRIKIRRDTSARWYEVNPLLLVGEQGYESDTGKMKIGDGSTRWVGLPYFGNDITQSDGRLSTTRIELQDSTVEELKKLGVYSGAEELETQDQATNILIDSIFDTKDKLDEAITKLNIKVDSTKTELLETVEEIRDDVNEVIQDMVALKNQTISEIEEDIDDLESTKISRNLTSNLTRLPSLLS